MQKLLMHEQAVYQRIDKFKSFPAFLDGSEFKPQTTLLLKDYNLDLTKLDTDESPIILPSKNLIVCHIIFRKIGHLTDGVRLC